MIFSSYSSKYDKLPTVKVGSSLDSCSVGWDSIIQKLEQEIPDNHSKYYLVIECYNGVLDDEVKTALSRIEHACLIDSSDYMYSSGELDRFFRGDITDNEIFGYLTRYNVDSYFDPRKVETLRANLAGIEQGLIILYGVGAAYLAPQMDLLVYADMARWEIQQRFRKQLAGNIGANNQGTLFNAKYKRGFFIDWRICDRFKRKLMTRWDYVLDTNKMGEPKMCTGDAIRTTLAETTRRPFRVVPFFDPGPWGGQWMKEVCDLDRKSPNFAWCFDCVPEENSLLLEFSNTLFEIPSIDLVFAQPHKLLGEAVHARFGDEFPIRFDFLDTMEGGNLSLQVHPLTEYIQEKFGMHYTQDESYYILDAKDDAEVYLGVKDDVNPDQMIDELRVAQDSGVFDAGKHVGIYPVRKHDHVLIPAGTIHCSGKNSMVLEISATPYIFTFKLWDWGRLGLDGRPRPINIDHGKNVIQWDRTENWVKENLINQITPISSGEGWREEKTGLHEREFIETRRFWFSAATQHHTNDGVNVLNLVEGSEVVIESPTHAFVPLVIHYAETFIIPANVGAYTITPYGSSVGKECAIIKAFVKMNA